MSFSVFNNSTEFLFFCSTNFYKFYYMKTSIPTTPFSFAIATASPVLFLYLVRATTPTSSTSSNSRNMYLAFLLLQISLGLLKISIEAPEEPLISIFNVALYLNDFLYLFLLSIQMRLMLDNAFLTFNLIIAIIVFNYLNRTLSLLPHTLIQKSLSSDQGLYIADNILPLLIQFIQSLSILLNILPLTLFAQHNL